MRLRFIRAVHEFHITVYLIDVRSECNVILTIILWQDLRVPYQPTVQIINVLRNQKRFYSCSLIAIRGTYLTELLKLSNCYMTFIWLLVPCQLYEVIVPLPDCHRVPIKKSSCTDLRWISLASIISLGLLPEAILSSEGWDAASRTDPSACHNRHLSAPFQKLGSLRSCFLLWIILIDITQIS